jgi:cysteine-rich repeat protein
MARWSQLDPTTLLETCDYCLPAVICELTPAYRLANWRGMGYPMHNLLLPENVGDSMKLLRPHSSILSLVLFTLVAPVAWSGTETPQGLSCGNSVLDGGEQCDDGNATPGDGCSATCRSRRLFLHAAEPANPPIWWRTLDLRGLSGGVWDEYSFDFGTPSAMLTAGMRMVHALVATGPGSVEWWYGEDASVTQTYSFRDRG